MLILCASHSLHTQLEFNTNTAIWPCLLLTHTQRKIICSLIICHLSGHPRVNHLTVPTTVCMASIRAAEADGGGAASVSMHVYSAYSTRLRQLLWNMELVLWREVDMCVWKQTSMWLLLHLHWRLKSTGGVGRTHAPTDRHALENTTEAAPHTDTQENTSFEQIVLYHHNLITG